MRNESSIFATDDKPKGDPKLGLSRVANRRQTEWRVQACWVYPEVRTDGAARAEPSLLELCRVATEEDEVQGGRLVKQIYGTSLKFIDYPYILK